MSSSDLENINFKPFFINTNLVLENEDLLTSDNLFSTIAGNTGNSYIGYAIIKIIYGHYKKVDQIQNIWNYDFSKTNQDTRYINENYTHVVFCMQDQLNTNEVFKNIPWNKITKFIEKINLPFIPVSVGANCAYNDSIFCDLHKILNKDLIRFINTLASKSELIGVRGEMTLDVLNRLGVKNVLPVGCPTFYEELNPNKQIIKKPFNQNFKIILNNSDILKNYNGNRCWILQDEIDIVNFLYFNQSLSHYGINLNNKEQALLKEYIANNNIAFIPSIETWKDKVAENDFYMGSRVHGGVIALNSSVPTLICQNDIRAFEMTDLLNIPYLNILKLFSENKPIEFYYNTISFDDYNKNFKNNYNNFMNFLIKNGVPLEKTQDFKTQNDKIPQLTQLSKEDVIDNIFNQVNLAYSENKNNIAKRENYIPIFKNKKLKHNIVLFDKKGNNISKKCSKSSIMSLYRKQIERSIKLKMQTQMPLKYEDYLSYFYSIDLQGKFDNMAKKYKNKKIFIYGAGQISKCILENFDLSCLNIVGVCDRIFKDDENEKYFQYKAHSYEWVSKLEYQVCLLFILNVKEIKNCFKADKIKLKYEEVVKI
ncbi:MAG: polysaccharide pyruvyl transferase family protein [Candidatus Gastranaerophilales bacterium]|nr:polysaccharide pyruvyl transferase family protein [Candidatus Gastranaerophilales bacterium]